MPVSSHYDGDTSQFSGASLLPGSKQNVTSNDRRLGMAGESRDNALDHVVVVVFENRSLDNVLGRCTGRQTGRPSRATTSAP